MITPLVKDLGRSVIYRAPGGDKSEWGVLTSFNSEYAFVSYGTITAATRFTDLAWSIGPPHDTSARRPTVGTPMRLLRFLHTFTERLEDIMASLTDIKAQLDTLQTSEQKLEAFALSAQSSLADLQTQLAAAQANSADPAALQAIADEITSMQHGVEAALPAATTPTPPAGP